MVTNSKDIIGFLEQKHPQNLEQLRLNNCPDNNLQFETRVINQYIVGATRGDEILPSVRTYEQYIKRTLEGISRNVSCFPWHFEGSEIGEMKAALYELAEHFHIKMDVERMIN